MQDCKQCIVIFFGILVISLILIVCCGEKMERVAIVENGKSNARIIISENASEEVKFVARELQTYLKKISDAEISIYTDTSENHRCRIFVGTYENYDQLGLNKEDLEREGFIIRTVGHDLVLLGKDDRGTQFAVYTFLERYLGVRWFWPGELGEVVPQEQNIVLGEIDVTENPDFKWRDRGPGGALWGATTGPTEMKAREKLLGVSEEHQAEVALWEKRNKWGGMKIYGGHSLGEVFPPEKYAILHPEYYALVDGKRAVPGPDYDYKHEGQICTTNPEVVEVAVQWVRKFFNEHPDYDGVHLTMNDGRGFCECNNCRLLDTGELVDRPGIDLEEMQKSPSKYTVISDRIFTFMNQVAGEVQKTHPGKYVVSMAYSRYTKPPKKIKLHPYVIPQYCLWSAYRHANQDFKNEHYRIAQSWGEIANGTAIYEYHINGSWPGMHRLIMSYIEELLKFLYHEGINLYQTQSGDDFAINGLNYYVAGKLLWDSSLSGKQILDDFYSKAFDDAAPAVKRFHSRLQNAWIGATKNGRDVSCSSLAKTRLLELFTRELIDLCNKDLTDAEQLTENDKIRKRIDFYKKGLLYTELTVNAVRLAKKLEKNEISLFPLELTREKITRINIPEIKTLVEETLTAWEKRDNFVEDLKNNFVLAYFWVKYNDLNRNFNPTENLKVLKRELSGS
jgi:hypothetical protein